MEEKYQEQFLTLLEAGFIACNQADEDSANKLFKAAKLLKPENSLVEIGLGYLHLHKLELKQACILFEKVMKREPENEMARSLWGISKSLMPEGATEGEKALHEMCTSTKDPYVKELTNTAIGFVDKFIHQKGGGPAELQKPKHKPKR